MTIPLKVDDIASYLAEAGWDRDPQGWRGASVWRHPGDYEVLVPPRDGMGDGARRVREVLRCLSSVEDRPAKQCPPLRTATGTPCCRAYPIVRATSSLDRQSTIAAGRRSQN